MARAPRVVSVMVAVAMMVAMSGRAAEAPAAKPADPPASPFDAKDPEIAAMKKLDWRSVDVSKLDLRTRCVSLIVMNKVLDMIGSKAALRQDLLMTYLDQNNLADDYAKVMPGDDSQMHLTYEEAQQVAAAVLKMPRIAAQFGDDLDGVEGPTLDSYFSMYTKTCMRNWAEVVEARCAVRSMAKYLEGKGQLDAFAKWASTEMERRQKEHDAELKQKQAANVEKEAEAQRKREEQAARNKEDSAISAASYAVAAAGRAEIWDRGDQLSGYYGSGDYGIWGGGYYSGAYWAGSAYRAGVRDRYNSSRVRSTSRYRAR